MRRLAFLAVLLAAQPAAADANLGLRLGSIWVTDPAFDLARRVAANQAPRSIVDPAADASFRDVAAHIVAGQSGSAVARDPATGRRSTFLYTHVPSSGWTFVAVVDPDR